MKNLLPIFFLLLWTQGICQDDETFQPDSVYMKNNVRSRKETFVDQQSKAAIIINYDKKGKKVKYTLTDNETGDRSQMDVYYSYDSNGRLSTETTYYDDSTIQVLKYFYDKMNRVIKKMTTIDKSVIEIDNITYAPQKVSKGVYFDDKGNVYKSDTVYYTTGDLYNNYSGFEIRDGIKHSWHYHLKASFDSSGKLVSNVYLIDGKPGYGDYYFYDEKGLLIKHLSGVEGSLTTKKYEYTFWN
jgi:hypothetical protein